MLAWDVYNRHGNVIDTVWYSCTMSAEEVVSDLLKHGHYDSGTYVKINKS
jgi:hypothetical protein